MNIDVFGITIARIHADYTVFYLSGFVLFVMSLGIWRQLNIIQEIVKANLESTNALLEYYIIRMEHAKEGGVSTEK